MREIDGIKVHANTKDLRGVVFGMLTALKLTGLPKHKATWLCQCECGATKEIGANSLLRGHTESCGCLRAKLMGDRFRKHGLHGSHEYWTWVDIRDRCRRQSHASYKNYGGRGISVCPQWDSYQTFYNDMGPRPSDKHSIERINNDGNYAPDNCKWATKYEQSRNKRQNVWVVVDGERMILKDAAVKFGVNYFVLHGRYCRRGWTIDRAIAEPVRRKVPVGT
jgi:hypothetical protein